VKIANGSDAGYSNMNVSKTDIYEYLYMKQIISTIIRAMKSRALKWAGFRKQKGDKWL
jgi:hypothetical protein